MNENERNKHESTKKTIKIIGFICLIVGFVCTVIGMVSFFSSFMNNTVPTLFFMSFIGLPLLSVGFGLLIFGYRKEIMRYGKNESVPIINEASKEVAPAIKNVVNAIKDSDGIECAYCHTLNEKDSKFCKSCGRSLVKICQNCHNEVANDAIYCDHCGKKLD